MIQGGISKNWFGLGNTMIYGEYAMLNDWGADAATPPSPDGRNFAGNTALSCPGANSTCVRSINNFDAVNGVIGTEVRVWGVGIGQTIDAAASTVYLAYRNFDADISCLGATNASGTCSGAVPGTGATLKTLPTEQIHVIIGGAVVKF
jgi:hypothetical protein